MIDEEKELQIIINWAKHNDIDAICNLVGINYDILKRIRNFKPVKWRNQSADSLSNIPFLPSKDISELNISSSVLDSLYIREKKKDDDDEIEIGIGIGIGASNENNTKLLYMTPHLIFTHYNRGESNVNFFQDGNILPDEVSSIALYTNCTPRTYDNRSLEIYEAIGNNDEMITSLGLLTERRRGEKRKGDNEEDNIKSAYTQLLDSIGTFFNTYLYIPYFIHPYRLIYFENNNVLKLVSCNLLNYIFVPHCSSRKIKDSLFSHPLSFSPSQVARLRTVEDLKITLIEMIVALTLDFFHSSFVTALWLATHDVNITKNQIILNRNVRVISSSLKLNQQQLKRQWLNDNNKTKTKKKKQNTGETFLGAGKPILSFLDRNNNHNNHNHNHNHDIFWKPLNTLSLPSPSSLPSSKPPCNNLYGFCACFSECSNHTYRLVHNYGCQHIMSILPNILRKCFETESHDTIRKTIYEEINLLKKFVSSLFTVNNNVSDDNDDNDDND